MAPSGRVTAPTVEGGATTLGSSGRARPVVADQAGRRRRAMKPIAPRPAAVNA
jgi:hypothetical protein